MESLVLTIPQIRKVILEAAGLARKAQFGTGIEAVYRVIDHLGFVQLDTNYVVERAHHHVMAARIPDYQTEWLAELCGTGACQGSSGKALLCRGPDGQPHLSIEANTLIDPDIKIVETEMVRRVFL